MTTLIYDDPSFGLHETPEGHPERADRYTAVKSSLSDLSDQGVGSIEWRSASPANDDVISLVHPQSYIDRVSSASPQEGFAPLDPDTYLCPSTVKAARTAVGAAVDAIDQVFLGEARNAFVIARPPGHHAEPTKAMGFCLFSTAAIAAMYARRRHGARRIAVVDFDVHHGNGTEAAFWHEEEALFVSSHEFPQYPGTGRDSDRGAYDNICNVPLATGTAGDTFREVWSTTILPKLSDFDPDVIVISAGFDAHRADPLGGLRLEASDFAWVTREIMAVADKKSEGKLISVLEGGYDLGALAESAKAHVSALADVAV